MHSSSKSSKVSRVTKNDIQLLLNYRYHQREPHTKSLTMNKTTILHIAARLDSRKKVPMYFMYICVTDPEYNHLNKYIPVTIGIVLSIIITVVNFIFVLALIKKTKTNREKLPISSIHFILLSCCDLLTAVYVIPVFAYVTMSECNRELAMEYKSLMLCIQLIQVCSLLSFHMQIFISANRCIIYYLNAIRSDFRK